MFHPKFRGDPVFSILIIWIDVNHNFRKLHIFELNLPPSKFGRMLDPPMCWGEHRHTSFELNSALGLRHEVFGSRLLFKHPGGVSGRHAPKGSRGSPPRGRPGAPKIVVRKLFRRHFQNFPGGDPTPGLTEFSTEPVRKPPLLQAPSWDRWLWNEWRWHN